MRADIIAHFKYYMTQDLNAEWILLEKGTDYTVDFKPEAV